MTYFNLHTHHLSHSAASDQTALYNVPIYSQELPAPFSVGIHPWFINGDTYQQQIDFVTSLMMHPGCVAVGESGLDKVCSTPPELQKKIFLEMIRLSEQYQKPLIIHCVKAFDELLALRRSCAPKQPWIIHGYRGKPEQARQLVDKGIFLSFGSRFNPETIRSIPVDNFFLETDESETPISTVYQQVAYLLGIPLSTLREVINNRAGRMFGIVEPTP